LFRRFVEEIFQRGNLAALDEILAPDALIHDPGVGLQGVESLRPSRAC